MNVAVIIATCGDQKWAELAYERAYPSVLGPQGNTPGSAREIVMKHCPELTVAQARNVAARFATADWLCFLDADDELEPGYLDAMARSNDGWVYPALVTGWETVPPPLLVPLLRRVHEGNLASAWASYPNKGRWPQVNECVIGTLVHRRLFEEVGGFRDRTDDGTEIAMYEDWDLWLRCWDAGAALVYTDAIYREHVSTGRNTNAHLSQPVYDAIWADHMRRTT